jgi:SOS-response transcriptional repressor LexA
VSTATMVPPLTARQRAVYRFIYEHAKRHGRQPTWREIMDHFGFVSANAVTAYRQALARKGYVEKVKMGRGRGEPRRSFDFLLTPDGRPFLGFREVEK